MRFIVKFIILSILGLNLYSYDKINVEAYLEKESFKDAISLASLNEKVYVLFRDSVEIYTSTLSYISSFKLNLKKPVAISGDKNGIYILDLKTSGVYVYSSDGEYLFKFAQKGNEAGQLSSPLDIKVKDKVYIANTRRNQISIYTKDGIFINSINLTDENGLNEIKPCKILYYEDTRDLDVIDCKTKNVLRYDLNGRLIKRFPVEANNFAAIDGFIYTVNGDDGKIREFDRNYRETGIFGTRGKGKYEFFSFTAVASYVNGLFILDSENKKILYLNISNKNFTNNKVISGQKVYDYLRISPDKIIDLNVKEFNFIDEKIVYYPESKDDRNLMIYDSGKISKLIPYGKSDKEIKKISDIVLNNDIIYILDSDDCKIKLYDKSGNYKFSIGDKSGFWGGNKDGKFSDPVKIAFDSNSNIYALDKNLKLIQVFSKDGIFLYSIDLTLYDKNISPLDMFIDENNDIYMLDSSRKIFISDKKGKLKGNFILEKTYMPVSFTYDNYGNIFVLDRQSRVFVYSKEGQFLQAFLGKGDGERELQEPKKIHYIKGKIYVADLNRILSFNIDYVPHIKTFEVKFDSITHTVDLSWNFVNNKIVKSTYLLKGENLNEMNEIKLKDENSYLDKDLKSGVTYYYQIKAVSLTDSVNYSDLKQIYVYYQEKIKSGEIEKEENEKESKNRPPLEIIPVELKYIFSSNYKYYINNPVGSIEIKNNTDSKFENIKVSFFIKNYMDFPSDIIVEKLLPHTTSQVNIIATFNNKILTINENTPVQSQISVSYYVNGEEKKLTLNFPVKILSKDSVVWDSPERIANFITVKDPNVNMLAKKSLAMKDEFKTDIDDNLVSLSIIFNTVKALNIKYVKDPVTPFAVAKTSSDVIIDSVQYPVNTLKLRTGDCDDLTALFASLLEAVGVKTVIMDYPDHITLMVNAKESNPVDIGLPENMLVKYNDSYYIPVEVTALDKTLLDSINYAANNYTSNKDKVNFVDVREALKKYNPPSLPSNELDIEMPDIKDKVIEDINLIKEKSFKYFVELYNRILSENSDDTEVLLNLGLVYSYNGKYDKAEDVFEKILKIEPYNALAFNNLGNIHFLKGEYEKAIEYYKKAYEIDKFDAHILVNISRAYMKLGKKDDAKLYFDKAVKLDKEIKKYSPEIFDNN